MKLNQVFLTFFLLLFICQIAFSQTTEKIDQPLLVDEFGETCSDDLKARLDALAISLQNDPASTGFIVFHTANLLEGKSLFYSHLMKNYLLWNRGIEENRLSILRGNNLTEAKIQLWNVPFGAIPPKPEEYKKEKILSTTKFHVSWADWHKDFNGRWTIYDSFSEEPCDFGPNMKDFAERLKEDSDIQGYLVIYTQFGKGAKTANKVAQFAINDLVKSYKVPRIRLRTIYGGSREYPEIELWFVPKGDNPPKPIPGKKSERG